MHATHEPHTAAVSFTHVVLTRRAPNGNLTTVLPDLSFAVDAGEVLAIVGPSGAGKTTLLHLVNRMHDADSGTITVAGRSVTDWSPQALRRHAALAFQAAPMLPGTVYDNLAAPLTLVEQQLPRPTAEAWLAAVDLSPALLDQDAATLSGGQKQRVALLRTLAAQPAILLVDEVTAALDFDSAQVVEGLILQRVREHGLTVLWITHDEQQARRVASRILRLEAGSVAYHGPAAAYQREVRA